MGQKQWSEIELLEFVGNLSNEEKQMLLRVAIKEVTLYQLSNAIKEDIPDRIDLEELICHLDA